jgi:biotin carboxyl carrier protein
VQLTPRADGGYDALIDGRAYAVQAYQAADGRWVLELDGRRVQVYTASDGPKRYAQVLGGDSFALQAAGGRQRRRGGAAGGAGRLTAAMPGLVVDVLVSAGDSVRQGQALVVLEAMKMEIRVSALQDGVVRAVRVSKGDVVEREQLLVELADA